MYCVRSILLCACLRWRLCPESSPAIMGIQTHYAWWNITTAAGNVQATFGASYIIVRLRVRWKQCWPRTPSGSCETNRDLISTRVPSRRNRKSIIRGSSSSDSDYPSTKLLQTWKLRMALHIMSRSPKTNQAPTKISSDENQLVYTLF